MDSAYKINASNTILYAKEFTLKAMEYGMIPSTKDPEETAQFVVKFYQTVIEKLNE